MLAEEAPEAYKDVDEVIALTEAANLARPVARLRPFAVIIWMIIEHESLSSSIFYFDYITVFHNIIFVIRILLTIHKHDDFIIIISNLVQYMGIIKLLGPKLRKAPIGASTAPGVSM